MDGTAHIELSRLLKTPGTVDREAAWEDLIGRHTRLIMAVARSFGRDHDDAMERYTFILGKLRDHDFRRLRAYDPSAGASFTTWLTVTARHLCLDHQRTRFGRYRTGHTSDQSTVLRAARRALSDLTEGDIAADSIPDVRADSAHSRVVSQNREECLKAELSRLTPRERRARTPMSEAGTRRRRAMRKIPENLVSGADSTRATPTTIRTINSA